VCVRVCVCVCMYIDVCVCACVCVCVYVNGTDDSCTIGPCVSEMQRQTVRYIYL